MVGAFTAPFNNMGTLNYTAQPTNTFFATVNQNNVQRQAPPSFRLLPSAQ